MMNSVQSNKEWQISQPALQSPSLSESPLSNNNNNTNSNNTPTSQASYSPTPTMTNHSAYPYPQNTMIHPPLHPYPTPNPVSSNGTYLPSNVKNDTDPRLPGLVLSQPGTPRPNSVISDDGSPSSKKARHSYISSFSSMPYQVMPRKRSRNEPSIYPTETGPSFSAAKSLDNLYSPDRTNLLTVRVQSKMDRGFFLADNDWTCYRRNYFQVSSTFGIHGINHYYGEHEMQCFVQTGRHGLQPVTRFALGISARVSNSDKQIDLVQHTPKRDKGPQMTPEPKVIAPGGNLSLSSVGNTQNIATFERIQFKTATANNGKRRAAQQYYVVVVELFAETHEGERIIVASCISSPLVVRGRSPGHYADNQDRASSSSNASMMAAAAAAAAANDSDRYNSYPKPPMTPPTTTMMSNGGQEYPYNYYSGYPTSPFPHGMMVPSSHGPLPTPSSSSPHPTSATNTMSNGTSSTATTPSTVHPPLPPPNSIGNSNNNNNSHQPYMVHSMSDPSSSESSSPDIYQETPGDYSIQQSGKPHPSQINIHSLPMDPTAHHGEWSRSRYHSAGSVPSPTTDQNSYFSHQQQQQHRHHQHHPQQQHHHQQHHPSANGAPPTPTTPFSSRKYDTISSNESQQQQPQQQQAS